MKKALLLCLIFLMGCSPQESFGPHLSKKVIKKIYPGIVEVIVPKIEDVGIEYERPLPFDKQDFQVRNDKYHPIGTAFFISDKRLASAAHVFGLDSFSLWKEFFIRDSEGGVHKVSKILKYSQYRDYIEFELESYPKKHKTLPFAKKVEIGDMVYAVGNAQGEGISTRGGQVSSFTPEHVKGAWDFIRFSSPASPGNSGGPLVNSKGEAVGVVVMKNGAENLNFALPIKELKNISSEKAEFFERSLKVQDGIQVVSRDWSEESPLPGTLTQLRRKAVHSKNAFYEKLIQLYKETYAEKSFPKHPRFRDYLRSQRSPLYTGHVDKDPNLNQWTVEFSDLKKMMVAADQAVYYGGSEIFNHEVLIETPKGTSLKDQLEDTEGLMRTVLRALGANRAMADERIPILSYGPASESKDWRDRLGRAWRSHYWYIGYNNSFMAMHTTPLPKGVLCFIDVSWASGRNEGYDIFVRENILELTVSYAGNPVQWREFLGLDQQWLPKLFHQAPLKIQDDRLTIDGPDYKVNLDDLKLSNDSEIAARLGYDPSQLLGPKVVAWEIRERKTRKNGVIIGKVYGPSPFSLENHRERWDEMENRRGRYNGKVQSSDGILILRKPLGKKGQDQFWSEEGAVKVESQFVASCFAEPSKRAKWPQSVCSKLKKRFRAK